MRVAGSAMMEEGMPDRCGPAFAEAREAATPERDHNPNAVRAGNAIRGLPE